MKIVPKRRRGKLPIFGRCCYQNKAMVGTEEFGCKIYHRYRCSYCGNEWLYRCGIEVDKKGNRVVGKDSR